MSIKKILLSTIVVYCLALGTGLMLAQEAATPAPAPAPYSYAVFSWAQKGMSAKANITINHGEGWERLKDASGQVIVCPIQDAIPLAMNTLAAQGWQLVEVVQTGPGTNYFLVKRPTGISGG